MFHKPVGGLTLPKNELKIDGLIFKQFYLKKAVLCVFKRFPTAVAPVRNESIAFLKIQV